jgi:hypothetical protein
MNNYYLYMRQSAYTDKNSGSDQDRRLRSIAARRQPGNGFGSRISAFTNLLFCRFMICKFAANTDGSVEA